MKENSIREDIERLKLCSTNQCNICGRYEKEECMLERNRCEQHILSDYKRVLKENEELKQEKIKNSIPTQKVKDKMEKDIKTNEHTILGGRRNGKTLEYGKRLGRIEMCQELLEGRK